MTDRAQSQLDEPLLKRIRKLAKTNKHQLSADEYIAIAEALAAMAPCRFLSFSTGNDVAIWAAINVGEGARSTFLEHDPRWVESTLQQSPGVEVHTVRYQTSMRDADALLGGPIPELELPDAIASVRWDVIFVDGPTGFDATCPGRFQSIQAAAGVSGYASHVFVHDVDRRVEADCCRRFIEGPFRLEQRLGRLAHYVPTSSRRST